MKYRKPDFESESIRAWVSDKKEVSSLKDNGKSLSIKINNIEIKLYGFDKVINKEGKICFAFKIKHDKKSILYHIPIPEIELTENDKEVIEFLMGEFKQTGYSLTNMLDSVQNIKDHWKHLKNLRESKK